MEQMSALQRGRLAYLPAYPDNLLHPNVVSFKEEEQPSAKPLQELSRLFPKTISQRFFSLEKRAKAQTTPLRIGMVFSGGQASGGHNVIVGICHAVKQIHPASELFGFLNGCSGIIGNKSKKLTEVEVESYFNQGGFDLIGTGRTKIETAEQLASSLKTCQDLHLDGLIVIGGDDSNTNAALLAEYFLGHGCLTRVIGVPKTIDGDLRSSDIEISFGFDSACKTYSEIIGNIARDALSAKKYYHFIKLMGRSASHITLECALSTHPNLALIGEEERSLDAIVGQIADLVCRRLKAGKEYGVILLPEGLIEFIPELRSVVEALNKLLAEKGADPTQIVDRLNEAQKTLFMRLPEKIQKQLLMQRDPHGNVQVSQIDTQVLLMELVRKELVKRQGSGLKFTAQEHFLGYEGRSCFPSNFDANYAYALGRLAAIAVRDQLTGMICAIRNLRQSPAHWVSRMVPIVQLMHLESRMGKEKPVIRKTLVDIHGEPFQRFAAARASWEIEDAYLYPGPMQFFGSPELTDAVPITIDSYVSNLQSRPRET